MFDDQSVVIDRETLQALVDAAAEAITLNGLMYYTDKHKKWCADVDSAIQRAERLFANGADR